MGLRQGVLRFDSVKLLDLIDHVFKNYAKINDLLVIKNKKEFEEPPDLTRPIDVYFMKQEEFQKLAADSKVTISKAEIVLQMQTLLSATVMIISKYLMWKKMSRANLNCKYGKKYFRAALGDVEDINKLTIGESGLTANNVSNMQSTQQKVRDKMAEKLGESFDNLTMAVTEKIETIDAMAQSISKLTSSNYELTATIKKLTYQPEL